MSRKSLMLLLAIVIAGLLLWLLFPSDETRIRKLIKDSVEAVEVEDLDGVMGHIAFGYQDEHGLSYVLIKKNLEKQFQLYSDIQVEYEDVLINVMEEGATASVSVLVLATYNGQRGYVLGDLKEAASIELELAKNPAKKWLIMKTAFQPGSKPPAMP